MPATDIYYSALHYAKKAQAAAEDAADIRASLTNVFEFKGTVDSVSDLPAASADKTGWVYIVGTGDGNKSEYVCTGTAWEELGPTLVMTDASESAKGVAKIATSAEASDGTDDTKIMTPAKVKAITAPITAQTTELTANLNTARNDLDDLGDQVSNIESKIPAAASTSNLLVTQSDLDDIKAVIPITYWEGA